MDAPKETKKRGRPAKNEELVEPVVEKVIEIQELTAPSQVVDIKHVFRTISAGGILDESKGLYPREVVEDYLNQNHFSQGYTLYEVYHLRTKVGVDGTELGEYMLYVLVKYAQ